MRVSNTSRPLGQGRAYYLGIFKKVMVDILPDLYLFNLIVCVASFSLDVCTVKTITSSVERI